MAWLRWLRRLLSERGGVTGPAVGVLVVTGGVLGGLVVSGVISGGSTPGCTGADVTTATFASRASGAAAGDVLCLTTGSYGEFTGGSKSSPGVTLRPASGATPTMTFDLASGDSWWILDGIKITGPHSNICGASNITVKNAEVRSYVKTCGGTNIVLGPNLDWTYADDPTGSGLEFEGRLSIINTNDSAPGAAGLLVTGSKFHGNCADGIFSNSGGWTVEDSEFYNLLQGSCAPHIDAFQDYSGASGVWSNVTFRNLYVHEVQGGLDDYDSRCFNCQVLNSVFVNVPPSGIDPCAAICLNGTQNLLINHVTIVNGDIHNDPADHSTGAAPTGTIIRNSILPTQVTASWIANDHNMCRSGACQGTGSLTAIPTWVGGANPITFAGFGMAGGSAGKGVASDGTDIGVNP